MKRRIRKMYLSNRKFLTVLILKTKMLKQERGTNKIRIILTLSLYAFIIYIHKQMEINQSQPTSASSSFITERFQTKLTGRVRGIFAAQGKTFVVFLQSIENHQYYLLHINSEQKILWEKKLNYPNNLWPVQMLTARQFVIVNIQNKTIDICSLKTHNILSLHYDFSINQYLKIFVFKESKYFCISVLEDTNFRLSYFSYQSININSGPIAEIRFSQLVNFTKIDEYSNIAWSKVQKQFENMVNFTTLIKTINGKYQIQTKSITITNMKEIKQSLQMKQSLITTKIYCKLRQNQYLVYLVCIKTHLKQQKGCPPFVLFVNETQDTAILKEITFLYGNSIVQLNIFHGCYFRCYPINKDCFAIAIKTVENQIEQKQIYFINPNNKRITHIEPLQSTSSVYASAKANIFIEIFRNSGEKYIHFRLIHYNYALKDVFLSFLLHLNEDFDDDLLQDAINLLC